MNETDLDPRFRFLWRLHRQLGSKPWVVQSGEKLYPQQVVQLGDAKLMAETYTDPNYPPDHCRIRGGSPQPDG